MNASRFAGKSLAIAAVAMGMLGAAGAARAQTTICQATAGGYGSYCSDQTPSATASGGYNSLPSWVSLNKTLAQIAVADNRVWGVDGSGVLWELPNFKTSTAWVKVGSGVTQISAKHNLLCELSTNTHVYCTQTPVPATTANANGYYPVTFTDVGATNYTQIAASAGTQFWAVDANHNLWQVKDYTNPSATATMAASGVGQIAVDGRGLLCETDTASNVYCNIWPVPPSYATDWNGYHSLSGWVQVGIQLTGLSVADGKVFGTDPNGSVWMLPDYTNSATWEKIAYGGVGDMIAGASAPSVWTPSGFAAGEVAVMVFMGQSNSTGINSVPPQFIAPSSPNVWGVTNQGWNFLSGNANGTTPFTAAVSTIAAPNIGWSNWKVQSNGADMNLGFNTSASGSAANLAAFDWQELINAGWKLPDLYEIHIGWASQGVDPADSFSGSQAWVQHGVNLWQPLLTNTSQPSYALAPFSRRVLNLALANLLAAGKTPRLMGLQWNQWEEEAGSGNSVSIPDAPTNYKNLFNGFESAVGQPFPVQFIKPLSTAYGATALSQMQTVFSNLVSGTPGYYSELDISTVSSNIYSGGVYGGGDGSVHYNIDTHIWFAQQAIGVCVTNNQCGTRITSVPTTPTN